MKLISWNVNGINSCMNKGLLDFMKKENADAYCFQEIKVSPKKLPEIKGYEQIWYPAKKKGYAGTAVFVREKPLSVIKGIGDKTIDDEGRVIVLEFRKFYLMNIYFPYSGRDLSRIKFKMKFDDLIMKFCEKLRKKKPVVIASDFNVAHEATDLAKPKENEGNAGFHPEERKWFGSFLQKGYVDTFRIFTKEGGHYTWWSWRFNARNRNIGWRVDYFVVSKNLKSRVKKSWILKDVLGSDHAPIGLVLNAK
jgi:exodeoxyribonuclease-3